MEKRRHLSRAIRSARAEARARDAKERGQVDLDELEKRRVGCRLDRALEENPRVRDQHVDTAVAERERFLDGLVRGCPVAVIAGEKRSAGRRGDLAAALPVPAGERDRHPLVAEPRHARLADPGRSAGDERGPALEPVHGHGLITA